MADFFTETLRYPFYTETVKGMATLRKMMLFCDVVLIVDGVEFKAHKVILSARSRYFETMFCKNFSERDQEAVEINDFNPSVFETILEYIYTGEIDISLATAPDVLKIADYLQLDWLKKRCYKFLWKYICVDNCIEFWKLAKLYCPKEVVLKMTYFIRAHINEASTTEDFLDLDVYDVKYLLNYVQLTKKSAKGSFNAIMRWIKYNEEERSEHLEDFLGYVKTQFLPQDFLDEVVVNQLIETKDGLNWLRNNFVENSTSNGLAFMEDSYYRRSEAGFQKHLFILSGNYQIYSFDTITANLSSLPDRPASSDECCMVAYKGDVYLMGGGRKQPSLRFDLDHKIWQYFPFRFQLNSTSACVVNDSVYFTGGRIESYPCDTVLSYDFNRAKMFHQTKMLYKRRCHGSTSFENTVYVCGGVEDSMNGGNLLRKFERMDVREGKWFSLPDMPRTCGDVTVAMTDKALYCHKSLTDCFDLRGCFWDKTLTPNPYGWSGEIATYKNNLYMVTDGGVSRYCNLSNSWMLMVADHLYIPFVISLEN